MQIRVHQASNSTVPKTYEYSLPVGYYPNYIVGQISGTIGDSGVHYATFSATTSGKFSIKLRQNTYGTDVSTIYGELTYPL